MWKAYNWWSHFIPLSLMCLHLNGFLLENRSVESIFSLDLSELGWREGVEDSWLFVTAVEGAGQWQRDVLNNRWLQKPAGNFWVTAGAEKAAGSEFHRSRNHHWQPWTLFYSPGKCWNFGGMCCCKTQKKLAGRLRSLQRPAIPSWPQYHQLPFSDWLQHLQVNWQLNGNRC